MEFEFNLENPLPISQELLKEDSTVTSLFNIEADHMPSETYSQSLKHLSLQYNVREKIVSLILNFSQNFDPLLSYLAINYLDRFLSSQPLSEEKPWILGLVAVSCVSLAMKMRKTESSVSDIQHDGGFIFDAQTIERMELFILGALKWRMRSITPFCFINCFISLFKFKDLPSTQALKSRATKIILKAQNEIKLWEFKPSVISASALLSASHELFPLQFPCFRNAISSCSYVNKENLLNCCKMMQEMAMEDYESVLDMVSSSNTPANVLDLHCSSSSSSDIEQTNPSEATFRLEKVPKRRKIGGFKSQNAYNEKLSQRQKR
ncbi:unnamed protein product [Coffea canephora]|uniref:Cyclin N-terminal domain-containing protein n=1 Tax=Coffea canephora TaxID=49390 RepID=A0A068UTM3_COFCA|nr:unnamed protein product [Coffea canephora]